jgi:hypothetical protein
MSELAVTALADRPRPSGGPSAVKSSTTPETNSLWYNIEISQRTVRSQGADRPQSILETKQRQQCLWFKLSNSLRTVRAPGMDRPQSRS